MRIRTFLLAALMIFSLAACSNVKDMKFTDANKEEVIDKVLKSGDLTDPERQSLVIAIGQAQAAGRSLTGKSVGEILAEAKAVKK